MREIKFRVYIRPLHIVCSVIELRNDGSVVADGYEYALESDAVDLMQFTGLTDVNGVDIYEGDIVVADGDVCVVIWHSDEAGFYIESRGDMSMLSGAFDVKIIGNKFQNPELLEQS